MRLSDDEMAREVRRAKRFNYGAFCLVLLLVAALWIILK